MTVIVDGPLASRADLMKPKDIAALLNIHASRVYHALETGELVGHKIGSRPKAPWRVRIEDVECWVNVDLAWRESS